MTRDAGDVMTIDTLRKECDNHVDTIARRTTILTDQERTIERLVQEKAELLAALRALTDGIQWDEAVLTPPYELARAAIKKAEGGE